MKNTKVILVVVVLLVIWIAVYTTRFSGIILLSEDEKKYPLVINVYGCPYTALYPKEAEGEGVVPFINPTTNSCYGYFITGMPASQKYEIAQRASELAREEALKRCEKSVEINCITSPCVDKSVHNKCTIDFERPRLFSTYTESDWGNAISEGLLRGTCNYKATASASGHVTAICEQPTQQNLDIETPTGLE